MKDIRITIVLEAHSKQHLPPGYADQISEGISAVMSGSTKTGYTKVVDVKVEEIDE